MAIRARKLEWAWRVLYRVPDAIFHKLKWKYRVSQKIAPPPTTRQRLEGMHGSMIVADTTTGPGGPGPGATGAAAIMSLAARRD